MRMRIIGGGPAGLFYAYLMKRDDPGHDVRVYERDPEDATYGWGVVFSDVALSFVREIAPELHASISRNQAVFDEMAVVHQGQRVMLDRDVMPAAQRRRHGHKASTRRWPDSIAACCR